MSFRLPSLSKSQFHSQVISTSFLLMYCHPLGHRLPVHLASVTLPSGSHNWDKVDPMHIPPPLVHLPTPAPWHLPVSRIPGTSHPLSSAWVPLSHTAEVDHSCCHRLNTVYTRSSEVDPH